jgi:hypothetical protein
MTTDDDMHARMEAAYVEQLTGQAKSDAKRRHCHFQVRLDEEMAAKLQSYMKSRDINANQALQTIISKFFK